jgi:hypothetical protein
MLDFADAKNNCAALQASIHAASSGVRVDFWLIIGWITLCSSHSADNATLIPYGG